MRKQNFIERAKLSPARIFKSPRDVIEADDIEPTEKLIILKAWEADERALLRAEDEGMSGGEHAHLHKRHSTISGKKICFTDGAQNPQPSKIGTSACALQAVTRTRRRGA